MQWFREEQGKDEAGNVKWKSKDKSCSILVSIEMRNLHHLNHVLELGGCVGGRVKTRREIVAITIVFEIGSPTGQNIVDGTLLYVFASIMMDDPTRSHIRIVTVCVMHIILLLKIVYLFVWIPDANGIHSFTRKYQCPP